MKDSGADPALAKAEPVARLGPSGFDPGEARAKLAAELTLQRRIHEHARDRARRELEFAEREIVRITDEFMRYVVEPAKAEIAPTDTRSAKT